MINQPIFGEKLSISLKGYENFYLIYVISNAIANKLKLFDLKFDLTAIISIELNLR